jgi:hypothetical protein
VPVQLTDQHTPEASQVSLAAHCPQKPPHPSGPHSRSPHEGVHATHCPSKSQVWPEAQVPHHAPQPLGPHCLPAQAGVQLPSHWPASVQATPAGQVPQLPRQPSVPHCRPRHDGVQGPQWKLPLHTWPARHQPHEPPHPSGPHCRLAQAGAQPQPGIRVCWHTLLTHSSAVHGSPSGAHSAWLVQDVPAGQSAGQVTEVSPGLQTLLPHTHEQAPPWHTWPGMHCQASVHEAATQVSAGPQVWPPWHSPQSPPHPSQPHCLPRQSGWHTQPSMGTRAQVWVTSKQATLAHCG